MNSTTTESTGITALIVAVSASCITNYLLIKISTRSFHKPKIIQYTSIINTSNWIYPSSTLPCEIYFVERSSYGVHLTES